MKIGSFNIPKININNKNRCNSGCLNTLSADTFERRNISFGKQSDILNIYRAKFRDDSEAIAILNDLDKPDIPKRKVPVYFEYIKSNIERYNALSTDEDLKIGDIIGLMAYELDKSDDNITNIANIARYKELKNNPELELAQYEMLLAVKFGLNDEQIKKYLARKNEEIEYYDGRNQRYSPTEDEWMLLIKENFDTDKLKQFAMMRNRVINFQNVTVRKQGGEQLYPLEYITEYIKKLCSDLFILTPNKHKDKYSNLSNLTPEQFKRYVELKYNSKTISMGKELAEYTVKRDEKPKDNDEMKLPAAEPSKLKSEPYIDDRGNLYKQRFLEEPLTSAPIRISDKQAEILAQRTILKLVSAEIIDKFPDEFFYSTTMGCDKKDYEIMQEIIAQSLSTQDGNDELPPLTCLGIQPPKSVLVNAATGDRKISNCDASEYTFDGKTGYFELKTSNPFAVTLKKGYIGNTPFLLVIDNNNKSNQYVAYNGIIAQVKPSEKHKSEDQFENWGHLHPKKQSVVLAKAADAFAFNLFDENGHCIIGQNAPDFNTEYKTDNEIEQYYSQKLTELKNNGKLTPQNILKLMPKNCMLSINPYISDSNMLYSIVTEWFSKDGNRWQMEIHSPNMQYNTDKQWIFRLHKETPDLEKYYFQFDQNNGYNFNGEAISSNAHIKIPSPLEDNNLLNNVDFQRIIQKISSKLTDEYKLNEIANTLHVNFVENDFVASARNIIEHCLKNPADFAIYRNEVTALRRNLGMINLI